MTPGGPGAHADGGMVLMEIDVPDWQQTTAGRDQLPAPQGPGVVGKIGFEEAGPQANNAVPNGVSLMTPDTGILLAEGGEQDMITDAQDLLAVDRSVIGPAKGCAPGPAATAAGNGGAPTAKKKGRPALPPDVRRSRRMIVRLTADEVSAIQTLARSQHLSASDYLRIRGLGVEFQSAGEAIEQAHEVLRQAGQQLRQLAEQAEANRQSERVFAFGEALAILQRVAARLLGDEEEEGTEANR